MIERIYNWLETLTIREAVILYLVLCIVVSVAIIGIDWYFRTRETRAIKRRDRNVLQAELARRAEARRKRDREDSEARREADIRKWGLLQFPYESRIKDSDLDPAHRTGQFSVPRSMRDFKGIHK